MLCDKFLWKGHFVQRKDIEIDIFDRGYNFGDGIYEVMHVYNHRLFAKKEHLDRLERSAKLIELNLIYSRDELNKLCEDFVNINDINEGSIYLQVTRGDSKKRNHKFEFFEEQQPVFSGFAEEAPRNKEKIYGQASAVTVEDLRGNLCQVKSLNLLPNVLAAHQAQKKGVRKAILIRDNIVTEEKSGNVLVVKNNVVYTHPDSPHILPGITKMVLKRACEEKNISYVEKSCTKEELFDADEVLVVDTGSETVSITEIDNKKIGDGKRGTMADKLQSLYEMEIENECGKLG